MARPKQESLAGMKSLKLKDLDAAMDEYVEIRDKRMALTPNEVSARKHLEGLMKKHNLKIYRNSDGDMVTKIEVTEEKAKVKSVDVDASGGED